MHFSPSTANPLPPNDLRVTYLSHVTAVIEWNVPSIAFSSETSLLEYGTDSNDFTSQTEQQFSGTDITVTNLNYMVRLTELSRGTTYYYRLSTTNIFGTTESDTLSFSTRMFCFCNTTNILYYN